MDGDATGLQRPALAEVRDALECDDCRGMTPFTRRNSPPCPTCDSNVWTVTDPRTALECLQTRGLAPGDDERRGFWCDVLCLACRGRKTMVRAIMPPLLLRYDEDLSPGPVSFETKVVLCEQCAGVGRVSGANAAPSTIPDLVAYASLGPAAILRAEELARETVARLRPWGAGVYTDEHGVERQTERVVWRVGKPRVVGGSPDGWPTILFAETYKDRWAEGMRGGASFVAVAELWWHAHVETWSVLRDDPCPHAPGLALVNMCLALDSITADAVTIVVPPITGAR